MTESGPSTFPREKGHFFVSSSGPWAGRESRAKHFNRSLRDQKTKKIFKYREKNQEYRKDYFEENLSEKKKPYNNLTPAVFLKLEAAFYYSAEIFV